MSFLLFTLIFNLWIWKILFSNVFLGILLIGFTILLFKFLSRNIIKKNLLILSILFLFICLFQWKLTPKVSLTNLDNDQIRVRDMRLNEYPPIFFNVGSKTIWLPIAHWFEGRKESIAIGRIKENIFSFIDFNQYFFASHPRERVGIKEIEKFPYIFIPFFLLGILDLVKRKKDKYFIFFLVMLPLLLISLIGNRCELGPFVTFPLIVLTISFGLTDFYKKLIQLKKKNILVLLFMIFFFVLVIVQTISYEIF